MRLDIFSELQKAQEWNPAEEATVIRNALEQGKLADELGYGAWWSVEHHGAGEFSQASTPEMFLTALAMVTKRLKLGHSGVLTPYKINHPVRVAERAAFLDIISNGRTEIGLARSSANEWETFEIAKEVTQAQFNELAGMLPKMWGEGLFSWDSDLIKIPEINVIPKPIQRFPARWACGQSLEGAYNAGRLGLGFLGTTVMESLDKTIALKKEFERGAQDRASDVTHPNSDYALFTFVHCAETREKAIENRAAESAMWYVNRAADYFKVPREGLLGAIRSTSGHDATSWRQASYTAFKEQECDPNDPDPTVRLLNRQYLGVPVDPEEAYEVMTGIDSVIIGTPEDCLRKMNNIQAIGVDRLLTLQQFGFLTHEQVSQSIRLIGEKVLPHVPGAA